MLTRRSVFVFLGVALISVGVYYIIPEPSPIVQISSGQLEGTVGYSRVGRPYLQYVGIPYASPPLGNLRFEPPTPPKAWEGVRKATSYGSQCLQIDLITHFLLGSEDCLYLDVFVPKHAKESGKLLPVMLWIHGGGFQSGSARIYRPTYFMDEDVVLVGVNYRLGALGFLNSGDHVVRGNQGMKDIVMALKWVQQNIKGFLGDPGSVTVFGESAGGGAVHFLMLSPLAKGLFHRAISQSGTVLNTWLNARYPKEQIRHLSNKVNCPTESTEAMVKCLKNLDGKTIVETHREMSFPPRPLLGKYAPSAEAVNDETTFLPEEPLKMLKEGKFVKIPWMQGVDSEEGLPFAREILEHQFLVDWANKDWDDFITQTVFLNIAPNRPPNTPQKLKEFYLHNSSEVCSVKSFLGLSELQGARFFYVSGHHSAKYHANHAPVYLYYYDYPSEFGFFRLMHSLRGRYFPVIETAFELAWFWIKKALGVEIYRIGTSHGEEMMLQFDLPFIPGAPVGSSDYDMSVSLVNSWVHFASSDLNKLMFKDHKWTPVDLKQSSLYYMEIAAHSRGMIEEPFARHVKLWDSLNII